MGQEITTKVSQLKLKQVGEEAAKNNERRHHQTTVQEAPTQIISGENLSS